MSAERVPPALRAVLEALRDAARWMHFGAERVVEGGPSPITKQHAAWLELDSCCVAALVSDAGTPERERCPYCSFAPESLSDYCDKHRPTFFAAALDAELDRLLCSMLSASYDHARGYDHGDPLSCAQCQQWVEDVHAHVARVTQEAREAGREAGARVMAAVHEAPAPTGEVIGTAELYDSYVGHLQETHPYPRDAMIPVDLVRREKEEG